MRAKKGQRRFFYHYNKQTNAMTLHFKGICHTCVHIECLVPCETKWNTEQPRIVMQGWANDIVYSDDDKITIV